MWKTVVCNCWHWSCGDEYNWEGIAHPRWWSWESCHVMFYSWYFATRVSSPIKMHRDRRSGFCKQKKLHTWLMTSSNAPNFTITQSPILAIWSVRICGNVYLVDKLGDKEKWQTCYHFFGRVDETSSSARRVWISFYVKSSISFILRASLASRPISKQRLSGHKGLKNRYVTDSFALSKAFANGTSVSEGDNVPDLNTKPYLATWVDSQPHEQLLFTSAMALFQGHIHLKVRNHQEHSKHSLYNLKLWRTFTRISTQRLVKNTDWKW